MKYKITKLADVENPYHKNSDFGFSKPFHLGFFVKNPVVGERFNLYPIDIINRGISTSPVTKIIDESTFETLNSVYKFEPYTEELCK